MRKLKQNGFLVQGLADTNNVVKKFNYFGINAYHQYPLSTVNDSFCKKLTEEQQVKKEKNGFRFLEFITDEKLLEKYLNRCLDLGIKIRILFIESDYSYEEWSGMIPETILLGYEYCPFPVDEQIISDLDWYPPFSIFRRNLNKNGLFDTYDEAFEFKNTYDLACENKEIGDGKADAFICRVSELDIQKAREWLL